MTTIADVARMANVSTSTVSHVINGTKHVNTETKARVERAIADSRFSPHGFARALRSGRSNAIGLVMSDTSQRVFAQVVAAVESRASQAGLTLLLANSREDPEKELSSIRALIRQGIDGLVIAPVADSSAHIVDECASTGTPVVVIDRASDEAADQVGIENRAAMSILTTHLIDAGRRDLLLLAGDLRASTLKQRRDGFLDAIQAHQGRVRETVTVNDDRLGDSMTAISSAIRTVRPDGVVASNSELTLMALQVLRAAEVAIPDDVALVSFDGIDNAQFILPRMTSVLQPAETIADDAMTLLLARMQEPERPLRTLLAKPTLFHGDSCGCRGQIDFV